MHQLLIELKNKAKKKNPHQTAEKKNHTEWMFLVYNSYESIDRFSEPIKYANDSRKKTKIAGKFEQKRT